MANSRKTAPKKGTLTEFPPPESGVAVADEPEPTESAIVLPETAQPAPDPPKRERGRPRREDPPVETNFWERVKSIARDDWGTRVFLYLYVLEPLCNLKQSGGRTYLNRYSEPVQDEHQVMMEYGSGRYRLMLALNKISPDQSNELARYEFEIYNPQHPPKIPRAAWINDARNAKWEALLPKETQPGSATAASTIVEAMKMVGDIRRDVREEMDPGQPEQTRTSEVLDTMRAAKELFSQPTASPATPAQDPLQIAVKLAETMMQMKADNPVIDMYRDELKALREELKEERAETRKTAAPAGEKPKTLMEQLTDFKALKDLFGANGNGSEAPVRTGRTGALDVIQTLGSKFFESDLASGVGQWLGAMAQRSVAGNGPPQTMANPGTQVQPQTDAQSFDQFVSSVLNPALLRQYSQGFSGADFAGWLYDAFPDRLKQLQTFTHPMAPGLKGAPVIIGAYKRTPNIWNPIVAQREGEPSFVQFVNEFCQWKPEDSEHDGVIDAEVVHEGDSDEERVS